MGYLLGYLLSYLLGYLLGYLLSYGGATRREACSKQRCWSDSEHQRREAGRAGRPCAGRRRAGALHDR